VRDDPGEPAFRAALVLGAGGFVGRHLADLLARSGTPVARLDLRDFGTADTPAAATAAAHRCREALVAALKGDAATPPPDLIVHAAGLVGSEDEATLRNAHVDSTRDLLDAVARFHRETRVVVIGSAAELGASPGGTGLIPEAEDGQPASAYGRSKAEQSHLARDFARRHGLDLVRVRLFNTLGPGQAPTLVAGAMVERLWQARAAGEKSFAVYNPFHVRDYLDVRDVARCLLAVAARLPRDPDRPPVNLCAGVGTTVAALAGELLAAANLDVAPAFTQTPGPASRAVGDNATLAGLLAHDGGAQIIPTWRSLADMWQARLSLGA
jgi:GDP-4-dehydro-6-deoxy-D-mannose reductase